MSDESNVKASTSSLADSITARLFNGGDRLEIVSGARGIGGWSEQRVREIVSEEVASVVNQPVSKVPPTISDGRRWYLWEDDACDALRVDGLPVVVRTRGDLLQAMIDSLDLELGPSEQAMLQAGATDDYVTELLSSLGFELVPEQDSLRRMLTGVAVDMARAESELTAEILDRVEEAEAALGRDHGLRQMVEVWECECPIESFAFMAMRLVEDCCQFKVVGVIEGRLVRVQSVVQRPEVGMPAVAGVEWRAARVAP